MSILNENEEEAQALNDTSEDIYFEEPL